MRIIVQCRACTLTVLLILFFQGYYGPGVGVLLRVVEAEMVTNEESIHYIFTLHINYHMHIHAMYG